jgi:hypothetical protein
MPLIQRQVTLGTAATEIVGSDNMPHDVILCNHTVAANQFIYIGSEEVTTTKSVRVDPGGTLQLTLPPNQTLWAVSDPAGLVIAVLDIRRAN